MRVWEPTPKQELALQSEAKFILYGGARGSGKTDTGIMWLLYNANIPQARSLVIRKNSIDLSDFIDRAQFKYEPLGAEKTGNPPIFTFPSGYKVRTGHLGLADAYTHYQGHEYQNILIEELTHIPTLVLFLKLMGSLRSTIPGVSPQFMGNSNPGEIGHEWVKEYWHIGEDAYPSSQQFEENGSTKIYIPATVNDNPYLVEIDPGYIEYLKNLPADLREKWYKGSWEEVDTENQYYAAIISRLIKENRLTSVSVEPSLRTFTSFDLGVKDKMVLWIAQIFGKEVRIVDCYAERNQPLKHYADYIRTFEHDHNLRIETVIVPPDAAVRSMTSDTLQTRAEKLQELGFNVEFAPAVSVDDGIEATRELLQSAWFNKNTTVDGLRALRQYRKEFDEKLNRYKDKPLHDWASDYADSFRYLSLYVPTILTSGASKIGDIQKKMYRRAASGH